MEKSQLQKELSKLILGEKEILKIENNELKDDLKRVTREFNEYKLLMQSKVLPRYDNFHRILRESEGELEKNKATNDALWNFIANNGLGQKCYNEIFKDLPSYHMVDLKGKNDSTYSEFDNGQAMAGLLYQVENFGKN